MLKSIIETFPDADINVAIVWINKLPTDSRKAAEKSAGTFNDPRICQFYDPQQRSGKAVANSLGWLGKVAWDIYLFYTAGSQWHETPPAPANWVHQLTDPWADPDRLRTGDDLVRELAKSMKRLLGK
ncbi:hypothetical protein ACFL2S_00445 [Thermodesulfobacteriota bacterium]